MAPSRTRTMKNKHAASKSSGGKKQSARKSTTTQPVGVVKPKKSKSGGASSQIKGRTNIADLLKKRKKRVYTEKELGIPQLNSIVPVGVQKPKGKKKGKVFVDDRESMATILAMVQAEKEGQIESKIMKARQMEEIREARRLEAEKKEEERKSKLEETKDALRKKRKRPQAAGDSEVNIKDVAATGSKAAKPRKRRVTFAE